jgi:CheY-like chemotaxis protein
MAKTILLADDSPTIRKIVELTFSDSEIRVEAVASGTEALDRLENLEPDLVLADVVMPEPTGYDICSRVKESDRPVPVLLLAGSFEPFDEERAASCGADGHLVKPFESRLLRDKVYVLLGLEVEADALDEEGELELVIEELSEEEAEEAVQAEEPVELEEPEHEFPPELVEAVARAVVERLSGDAIKEIAEEVVPELAASIIRQRIKELEGKEPDDA